MKYKCFIIYGLILFLSGCVTAANKRLYPGEALPREQVAVIKQVEPEYLMIHAIDGKKFLVNPNGIEILPGPHQVTVFYQSPYLCDGRVRYYRSKKKTLKFNAVAGKTYYIYYELLDGARWTSYILDEQQSQERFAKEMETFEKESREFFDEQKDIEF